jgi:CheY-specific phosphatase CheX
VHIKPAHAFAEAAHEVLLAEVGLAFTRGETELLDSARETKEVTVLISLVGSVAGTVVYSFSGAV